MSANAKKLIQIDTNVPTLPIRLRRQSTDINLVDVKINLIDCVKFPLFVNARNVGKHGKVIHISAGKDCTFVKNSHRLINKRKTARRPCKSIIVERHNYDKRANAESKSEKTKQVLKSIFQGASGSCRTTEKHVGRNVPPAVASCAVVLNALPESRLNKSDSDRQANGRRPSADSSGPEAASDENPNDEYILPPIVPRVILQRECIELKTHHIIKHDVTELTDGELYIGSKDEFLTDSNKQQFVAEFYARKSISLTALRNKAKMVVEREKMRKETALKKDQADESAPPCADSVPPCADSASPSADSAPPSADSAPPSADSALPSADSALPSADSALPSVDSVETVRQTDVAVEDNGVRPSVELTEQPETTKRSEEIESGDGVQCGAENIDEQTSNSSDNIIKQLTSIFENVEGYSENADSVVLSKSAEESNENLKPLIGKDPEEEESQDGVTILKEDSKKSQTSKENATDSSAVVEFCEQPRNDKKNESDEKTQQEQSKEMHTSIENAQKDDSQTADEESFKAAEKNSSKNGENDNCKDKERREKIVDTKAELKKGDARKESKFDHQKNKLQKENLKIGSKVSEKGSGKSKTENSGKKSVKKGDVDGANKPAKEQPKVTVLSSVSISKQENSQKTEISQKDDIEECVTRFVVTKIVDNKSSAEKSEGEKPDSRSSDSRQIFNEVLKLKSNDDVNRSSLDTKQASSGKKIKVAKESADERLYKKGDSSSRAYNTRKTHSSYAKIRVKSQESLMEPEDEPRNDVDENKIAGQQNVASNSTEYQEIKRKRGRPPLQKTINSSPTTPSKTEKAPNKEDNKKSRVTPTSINVTTSHLHSKADVAKISPKVTKDQCRLCGCSGDSDYVPLFGERAYEMDLLGKIHKHLEVKISESDGLPRQVCDDCANNVVSWARFHHYCSQVDDVLKEAHKQGNKSKQSKMSDTNDSSAPASAVTMSEGNRPRKEKTAAAESDGEDQIEKMLRAIHESEDESEQAIEEPRNEAAAVSNDYEMDDCALSDEDDMLVEYLDEEQDLIVEALSASKQKKRRGRRENGTAKKESATGAPKVIRVDRKLSDVEIKQLLNRLELQNKSTTKIMVLRVNPMQHFSTYDIDNIVKDLTEKRSEAQKKRTGENSTDGELNSHYSEMAASYAHCRLESIRTSNEMYFKCHECRLYLPAEQVPAHSRAEHGKTVALCDICSLLLPYDSDENKQLSKQHNDLHAGGKSSSHPDVIMNTCRIMENASAERSRQIEFDRESEQIQSDSLLGVLGNRIDDKTLALKEEEIDHDEQETGNGETQPDRRVQHRYKCAFCSLTFGSTPLYRSHVATHHGRDQFKCTICSAVFSARDNLTNHIAHKHRQVADENGYEADGTEYMCDTCGKIFVKEAVYLKHKQSHVGDDSSEKPFECPHCAKICSTAAELREHTLGHNTYATFLCDRCGQAFRTFQSQRLHRRHCRSGPGGGATLACTQCEYSTPLAGKLRAHVRAAHPNLGVFVCFDCDQYFHTARQLKLHRVQCHERNGVAVTRGVDTAYTCPLCDWQYQHEQNLQKHFEYHVEKGHTLCKVCHQTFQHEGDVLTIADVRAHKTKHSSAENAVFNRPYSPNSARIAPRRQSTSLQDGESIDGTSAAVSLPPRMMCKDCGEAFSTPAEMRKHQRVHKPFYCDKCKSVSLNENTFRQHMDQHHERTHECPSCGKLFMTRSALQLHSRAHTTEANHSCAVCQRKFVLATDWRRHERSCRESRGWPPQRSTLVATEGSSGGQQQQHHHTGRRASRAARNASRKSGKQEYALMITGEDNITYEYIDQSLQKSSDDSDQPRLIIDAVPVKQDADLIHLVLEEGDTASTDLEGAIEIDESELVAFQEWQKVASMAGKKRRLSAADSNSDPKRLKQFTVVEGSETFEGNARYVAENDNGAEYGHSSEIQYIISNGENGEAARFFISGETDGQVFEGAPGVVGDGDDQYTVHVEQKAIASNAGLDVTLDESQGPVEIDAENLQRYVLQTQNGQFVIPADGEVENQYILPEVDEEGQSRVVVVGGMTDNAEDQNYIVQDFSGGDVLVHDESSTQNYVFESDGNADDSENVSYVLNVPRKDGVATVYLKSGAETLTEMNDFNEDVNEAAGGEQNYVIVNESMPDLN